MRAKRLGRLGAGALAALLGSSGPLVAAAYGSPTPADSARARLAFRPLSGSSDYFTISNLTKAYGKDLSEWLRSDAQSRADLARLDRYGMPGEPQAPSATAAAATDSSDIAMAEAARRRKAADMTPEEKAALTPPQSGVHVGIPSAVASTGAMIGGLALLAKIITEFLR